MKLNKIFAAGVCAALAMSLVACGSAASSSVASSVAASSAASSVAASSAAAEEVTKTYTIENAMTADVTELYVYKTGESAKGDNLAATALKTGDQVTVDVTGYAEGDNKTAYTLEFVADGQTYSFDTLHVEDLENPIYLLGADNASGATAISFMAPAASSEAAASSVAASSAAAK